jgi:NAD+ kinase
MKTIGLIVNFKKEQAVESVKHVASLAAGMGFTVLSEARAAALCPTLHECPVASFAQRGAEAVVVLGGDGTMLDASHQLAGQRLPMMGLNIGSLGYLTSVEAHQFADALQQLREDRCGVSLRSALAVRVLHKEGSCVALPDALNDVVANHGATAHAVEVELLLDEKPVANFLCDGIIVATPTGSTAYSLAAGGPILLPETQALVISLICPHALTSRPLVMRDTARIAIRVITCDVPMILSSDGRDDEPLFEGDRVEIVRSPHDVPVIELHGYNPCDVLRRKLRWGGR